MYLVYSTNNLYFCLFYVFIVFFYFGIFLSIYNLELFTAFLWLTECVIIFVSILFLFYLNVYGNQKNYNIILYSFKYYSLFLFLFLFSFLYSPLFEFENYLNFEFFLYNFFEDYYESLFNVKMNDLFGLFISYYFINSLQFIILGILLLVASLVAVNLNKFNRIIKSSNYYDFITLFDFFSDLSKYLFLRKQNLTNQSISNASTRIFKKKIKI